MPRSFPIVSQSNFLIQIVDIINDKQCRSRSVGWIYTVCKVRVYPGSAGLGLRSAELGKVCKDEIRNFQKRPAAETYVNVYY